MSATLQRVPNDFWDKWDSTRITDTQPQLVEVTNEPPPQPPRRKRSLGRRALRSFLRLVITLGIGVGGTLAWQGYGDDARQLMAVAYPGQLGWIAPQATTNALATQSAPAAPVSDAPTAPPVDQKLNALSLNLAALRQSVEQLSAQVATGQQQLSGDIAGLRASEQDILAKISTPPPRPAPRKPAPPQVTAVPPPPTAAAAH
jgi:uncharacterized protein HemX